MCEYILLEDFKMNKYIYDKRNGLWYELQGDYYIRNASVWHVSRLFRTYMV